MGPVNSAAVGPADDAVPTSDDKHHCERAAIVRVIEYAIVDPGRPEAEETRYRLVPTILDPAVAPVADLAAWYAERWEFEPRSTS